MLNLDSSGTKKRELAGAVCICLNDISQLKSLQDESESEDEGETTSLVTETCKMTLNKDDLLLKMLEQNELLIKTLIKPQPTQFKIMPDFKATIKEFNGKIPRHEAKVWLTTINGVAKLHNWPDEFKLEVVRSRLVGPAWDWFHTKDFNTWNDFEEKFRRTYVGHLDTGTQWRDMLQRTQGRNEETEDYFQQKVRMCKALDLPFQDIKLQVIEGLWSKDLCDHLLATNHTDEDDLRDSIDTYERINKIRTLRIRKSLNEASPTANKQFKKIGDTSKFTKDIINKDSKPNVDPKKISNVEQRKSFNFKCYSCGQPGHISKDCPELIKTRTCRKCSAENHLEKNCPLNKQMTVERQEGSFQCKYIKLVKVNNCGTVPALIDTGATECTIRESVAARLGLERSPLEVTLKGFGGEEHLIVAHEACNAVLEIENVTGLELRLLIVPENAQVYELIVGQSWLDQEHIAYYSVDRVLKIGYREEYPFKNLEPEQKSTKKEIKMRNDEQVPHSSINLIEVEIENNTFCALIRNESDKTLFAKKGKMLDKGHIYNLMLNCEQDHNRKIGLSRIIEEGEVNVNLETTREQRMELISLLNEFPMCFATSTEEIGLTNVTQMDIIENPGSRPVVMKPYRASQEERKIIADIVEEWKQAGIVSETKSPYASPVLLVRKKNGEARLVVDYRKLNKQTVTQSFPIPNIDDQLETLAGAEYFVMLDLAHGYLQVPLSEEAKEKTAFVTSDDHAQFERMIFGLKNAPYEFSRLMNKVLGSLRNNIVLCYLDDLLIPARSWCEMLIRLRSVLEALRAARLTLRLSKCCFGQKEIEYLGFIVSTQGIRPGNRKKDAILLYPTPKDVKEVRQFLGLTGFFRRFVRNYSRRALPLSNLTKRDAVFQWDNQQQAAFEDLKQALTTDPALKLYNPRAHTELHTDASADGLAGMLLQEGKDGGLHLVYCVSKKTTDAEKNYHSSKLELLAVVWSLNRLRQFLIEIPFILVTDCQSLIYLNSCRTKNPQVCRWYAQLQEYTFEVKHRPGTRMRHVDALSRAIPPNWEAEDVENMTGQIFTALTIEDEVRIWQMGDEKIEELRSILEKTEEIRTAGEKQMTENMSLRNCVLYKNVGGRGLLVIPAGFRKMLLVKSHDLAGHFGVERTVSRILRNFWFPGMRRYAKKHIASCLQCIFNKVPGGRKQGELHPIKPGGRPFAVVHIDHLGPFIRSRKNNQHLLVIIDNLTRFVKLYPVKDTTAQLVIKHLKVLTNERGCPEVIVSDRGTAFTSRKFEEFCKERKIKHNLISVRHPRANGLVERVNRTVLPVIRSSIKDEEGKDWDKRISDCEQALNMSVNQSTNLSPFEMLYGYQPTFDSLEASVRELVEQGYEDPTTLQASARERIEKAQLDAKKRFDRKIYHSTKYNVGDLVFIRRAQHHTGEPTKTQPRYRGPMVVVAVRGGDSYVVSDLNAEDDRTFSTAVHVSDMKVWSPGNEEEEWEEDSEEDKEIPEPTDDNDIIPERSCANEKQAPSAERRSQRRSVKPARLTDYDTTMN